MFFTHTRPPGRIRAVAAVAAAFLVTTALVPTVASSASATGGSPASATGGSAPSVTSGACNYYYEWIGRVRFPLQPDPHATYTYVMPSNQAGEDGVAFMVHGDFPHTAWTSWMSYTGGAQPYSVANFVDNPPANTNNPVQPDAGSTSPFLAGNQMRATPRKFTLLFTPDGYTGPVADTLAGVERAGIPAANVKPYPTAARGNDGNFWVLANRNYVALPGFNPGGSTEDTFPTVTAVDLATGEPVDCYDYNVLPDRLQRPPTDPPNSLFYGVVRPSFALKNGSFFLGVDRASDRSAAQFSPPNPDRRVVFTRPPILPGADVSTIPPRDNCAGYVGTTLDPSRIALIRVPHVANYTRTTNVTGRTTYPNPADPSRPWEASYESVVQYGNSPGFYLPGTPYTTSLANDEFKIDDSGGSTFVVWPRNLPLSQQLRVFAHARSQGWAVIRGGTRGPLTGANMLFRIKAPASDYYGSLSSVPCFYGTTADPVNGDVPWRQVPVGTQNAPSQYVASPANMGKRTANGVISAAPQGVTCRSVRDLTSGGCVGELKSYIDASGGSYYAPRP